LLSKNKKYKGFTLLEVLIVMMIIASITGIAIVQFKISFDRSRVNKTMAEIETMGSTIGQIEEEMRKDKDNRSYIHQLEWLNMRENPDPGDSDFYPWQGPYVSSLHLKDAWGNPYYYDYWDSDSDRYEEGPYKPPVEPEWRWKLPPPETMGQNYAWYHVYGGSEKGGFVLGSYGSDGEPGGDGYAQDIIYRQYYPPIVQAENGRCGACFIATAAYGSYEEPHVQVLRKFRDKYLLTNNPGKKLVKLYYKCSPSLASFIAKHSILRAIVRVGLLPIIGLAYLLINTILLQQILLLFILALLFTLLVIKKRKVKTFSMR